jgi:hypothetical protein
MENTNMKVWVVVYQYQSDTRGWSDVLKVFVDPIKAEEYRIEMSKTMHNIDADEEMWYAQECDLDLGFGRDFIKSLYKNQVI